MQPLSPIMKQQSRCPIGEIKWAGNCAKSMFVVLEQ